MISLARITALFCLAFLAAWPATALEPLEERVVSGLSQKRVSITATFSGSEIFLFGAVERSRFLSQWERPPHVIIAVSGPVEEVTVRKKARTFGIWVNREAVRVASAPAFYAITSTAPLNNILGFRDDNNYRISIERSVFAALEDARRANPEEFREALIRLRTASGLYREEQGEVSFIGDSLFEARVSLPANIIEGDYTARVFLVRDQVVTDLHETVINVRKTGLERWIYRLAQDRPLIYGIGSILVALFAGWFASEVFRLLRQ